MLILALDTTTRQGSIALVRDHVLLETFAGDAAVTHGERLPGDLTRVLGAQGLRVNDVDLFAVAAGPGSFTGLRIGIAAMQGLALATGRTLVGVSALDALNDAVRTLNLEPLALGPQSQVSVWMDAQRGQVFAATYRGDQPLGDAIVDRPEAILATLRADVSVGATNDPAEGGAVFAGDGALAYRADIRRAVPDARIVEIVAPLAPSVARLAAASFRERGPRLPDAIRPIYIRRPDAELARDRRA